MVDRERGACRSYVVLFHVALCCLTLCCLATPLSAQTKAAPKAPEDVGGAPTESPPELFTLDVSWVYSHFGTEILGVMGPRLGLRLRLVDRFHVGVLVDGQLVPVPSAGPSVYISPIGVTMGLSASYDFLPFLSASVAPIVAVSHFFLPLDANATVGNTVAGGALVLVRGKLPLRDAHPFLELGVQATLPTRQALVGGSPALTVPEWQAQAALGVELPL
jgi:hypothetical protein